MFLERLVNGLSAMDWYQILILLVIVGWVICLVVYPFVPDKLVIVEQTLKDGSKRYAVKRNWFLGLPFLYHTEIEDYGLYECYVIRDTLEEAKKYVTEWYKKYNEKQEKKVKRQKRIKTVIK